MWHKPHLKILYIIRLILDGGWSDYKNDYNPNVRLKQTSSTSLSPTIPGIVIPSLLRSCYEICLRYEKKSIVLDISLRKLAKR